MTGDCRPSTVIATYRICVVRATVNGLLKTARDELVRGSVPSPVGEVFVAVSRVYRGMHHPTDVVGSLILAGAWLAITYLVIQPNHDLTDAPVPGGPEHKAEQDKPRADAERLAERQPADALRDRPADQPPQPRA